MKTLHLGMAIVYLTIVPLASLAAQDLEALVDAGRYEEAAASLQDASAAEARAGAMAIFNGAYLREFQRSRFTDAVRGFAAAKRIPIEENARRMLDFWHGMALLASVRAAAAETLSEEEASAVLEEAHALLVAAGDYPRRINMPDAVANVEMLLEMSGRIGARN